MKSTSTNSSWCIFCGSKPCITANLGAPEAEFPPTEGFISGIHQANECTAGESQEHRKQVFFCQRFALSVAVCSILGWKCLQFFSPFFFFYYNAVAKSLGICSHFPFFPPIFSIFLRTSKKGVSLISYCHNYKETDWLWNAKTTFKKERERDLDG